MVIGQVAFLVYRPSEPFINDIVVLDSLAVYGSGVLQCLEEIARGEQATLLRVHGHGLTVVGHLFAHRLQARANLKRAG